MFGKIDNLSAFTHPDFNMKFQYMDETQSIRMAKSILQKIKESGYKNIVVIESGTSPLVAMIKRFEPSINFIQLKIPRDLNFNLLKWFESYLDVEEFRAREVSLRTACKNINLSEVIKGENFNIYDSIIDNFEYNLEGFEEFHNILKGTKLFEVFNSEFLVFDEYINAGTIIKNFQTISKLFCLKPKFKLSAFCMFLDNPEELEEIAFTLYHKKTELECYMNGAYPFENRIDLIGYYYFVDENNFEKIYLENLAKEFSVSSKIRFYDKLQNTGYLQKLKSYCVEEQVAAFVKEEDIGRYIIKSLEEKLFGKTKYSDFLDQIFKCTPQLGRRCRLKIILIIGRRLRSWLRIYPDLRKSIKLREVIFLMTF